MMLRAACVSQRKGIQEMKEKRKRGMAELDQFVKDEEEQEDSLRK